jgi:hypothetical protein
MEVNELKEIWKKDQEKLIERIEVNEKRINEITIQNSKSKLEEYMNISIKGRNIALLYAALSLTLAWKVKEELVYSLPAVIAAVAMVLSFFQHLPLKKADYSLMNIIDLQSTIYKFQVHILKYAKFDMGIVALWLLTSIPILLKIIFKLAVFSNFIALCVFILFGTVVLFKMFSADIYKKWDKELIEAQSRLNDIQEFELE